METWNEEQRRIRGALAQVLDEELTYARYEEMSNLELAQVLVEALTRKGVTLRMP